jgi:CcmD family protein
MSITRIVLMVVLACLILGSAHAIAQPPQPPSAAQEGFVPVDKLPQAQDTIPAARLVAIAYAFVWVALFAYLWSIWRRLSTVERELQSVARRVETGGRRP